MGKVRIITDSSACLSQEIIEKYSIEVIPHRIKIGSSIFEEGVDFTANELFYELHAGSNMAANRMPEVVAPDFNLVLDTLQGARTESEQILAIHISSHLSSMVQQVRRAADMLKGRYNIRVLDSLSVGHGLRLLVERAAMLAQNGTSLQELARLTNGAIPNLYLATFTESLTYLERSTTLSASQSLLGTMLGIKAMLMMEEGKLATLEKVQTREEAVEKLYEFVQEFARPTHVGIFQHGYDKQRMALVERLTHAMPNVKIEQTLYPPSLAAYVGPNTLGVIVYEGNG